MLVKDFLRKGRGAVATVGPQAKVAEAAALLAAERVDMLVVCGGDQKIIGVITDSDIMQRVADCKESGHACDIGVSDVMARQIVRCSQDDDLNQVRVRMVNRGLRRMPVVDHEGRFVGLVSLREALLQLYEENRFEEEVLEQYFFGLGYH